MEDNNYTEVYLLSFADDERNAILDAEDFLTAEGFYESTLPHLAFKGFLVLEAVAVSEIFDLLWDSRVNHFLEGSNVFEEMAKDYEKGFYPKTEMARLYADLRDDIFNCSSRVYSVGQRTHDVKDCLLSPNGWYAVRVKINFGL